MQEIIASQFAFLSVANDSDVMRTTNAVHAFPGRSKESYSARRCTARQARKICEVQTKRIHNRKSRTYLEERGIHVPKAERVEGKREHADADYGEELVRDLRIKVWQRYF